MIKKRLLKTAAWNFLLPVFIFMLMAQSCPGTATPPTDSTANEITEINTAQTAPTDDDRAKPAVIENDKVNAAPAANEPVYGKYGCTASKYVNGAYEFIPRGSFTISKDGKYVYNGFEKPSNGSFTVDKNGNLLFKGGYLDGGKAEKIDRPNKFFLVFPANPDNRWTCTLVNE
jgi:hypothetical protein